MTFRSSDFILIMLIFTGPSCFAYGGDVVNVSPNSPAGNGLRIDWAVASKVCEVYEGDNPIGEAPLASCEKLEFKKKSVEKYEECTRSGTTDLKGCMKTASFELDRIYLLCPALDCNRLACKEAYPYQCNHN